MPKLLPTAAILIATSLLSAAQTTLPTAVAEPTRKPASLSVDLAHSLGPYTPIYSWFGYDEANYTTTPDGRRLLRELHDLSPVPVSIRAHHLLTSGNGVPELKWSSTDVYSEDASGKPIYDFKLIDGIFDEWKAAGVRPMVELGFMPKDLAASLPSRPKPYQVHYPQSTVSGASNNPPKDYRKWGELVRIVTAHLAERYGKETVSQWFFEVWNEPDIDYWHGTPEDYWKLYDFAVAGVRAVLPAARVGGPASTGPGNENAAKFLDHFLEHVSSGRSAATGKAVPLDFVSFHAKGQPKVLNGVVTMGLNKELLDVDRGFEIVAKYPKLRKLPIILSEADPEGCAACSSKVNPANNYRNGTLYPSYTAAAVKSFFDLQDRRQVNLLSMLSWSFEFEGRDFFEGFRSLSTNGIDKPVLNLFRMLALMSGTRVATTSDQQVPFDTLLSTGVRDDPDVDAFATSSDRRASILLWNYQDLDQPAPPTPASISVAGIPAIVHRVLVSEFRIDDSHSNAYTVWKAMGSPQQPSPRQCAELQSRAGLELLSSPKWLDITEGRLLLRTVLPAHAVSLLRIEW